MDELVKLLTTRRTLKRWHHELTAPDAELTAVEVLVLWCVQQLQPKTLKAWAEQLAMRTKNEREQPEDADTPPLTMLEAALIAAISANDQAVKTERWLELLYQHINIGALHQAATDPSYPKNEEQVKALAAMVRGESGPPQYILDAARMLANGRGGQHG